MYGAAAASSWISCLIYLIFLQDILRHKLYLPWPVVLQAVTLHCGSFAHPVTSCHIVQIQTKRSNVCNIVKYKKILIYINIYIYTYVSYNTIQINGLPSLQVIENKSQMLMRTNNHIYYDIFGDRIQKNVTQN